MQCEINVQLCPIAVSSPENSISMLMSHSNKNKFLLLWESVTLYCWFNGGVAMRGEALTLWVEFKRLLFSFIIKDMTTSVLRFDRELKTAESQICSSMKSSKRNKLSTLLVIFQYLLYLLTVTGFSFFRSIHLITPLLKPFFIRGCRDLQHLHVSICLISDHRHSAWIETMHGTRCKLYQPSICFDRLHHRQIHYIIL